MANLPALVGVAVASAIAGGAHVWLDWAPAYRGFAPALLFALVLGIFVCGEFAHRIGLPWPAVVVGIPFVVAAWAIAVLVSSPALAEPLNRFDRYLQLAPSTRALGTGEAASLVGDVQTPLFLFGLLLVVAVPVMVWGLVGIVREHRPAWIAVSAYAWYFVALSINRIRFAAQLALFASLFAAIGVLYLLAWADLARPLEPFDESEGRPSTSTAENRVNVVRTAAVVLLFVGLTTAVGVAQVPETIDEITIDDANYETATWMEGYAAERGWTHPRNYVFSEWGHNRFYNYVVSGESESYGYAQRNYRAFVSSSDAEAWYEALEGATGFVVVRTSQYRYPSDSLQVRLNDRFGSAGPESPGLSHYRLVYVSDDGTTKVYTLVPGATIAGNGTATATIEVETEVSIGDVTVTYRRDVTSNADGEYRVTVPYPGRYAVGSRAVTVTEADVSTGSVVDPNGG